MAVIRILSTENAGLMEFHMRDSSDTGDIVGHVCSFERKEEKKGEGQTTSP